MVLGRIRQAVFLVKELMSFGRAEEAQIDAMIEKSRAKLEMVKKMNKQIDEQLSQVQMDALKDSMGDLDKLYESLKEHDEQLSETMPGKLSHLIPGANIDKEAQVKLEKAEEMLLHKMTSTIEAKRRWEEETNEGGSGGSGKP